MKINCWDFMNCGREYGGINEERLGVCPAVTYMAFNGLNGGFAGGRYCWQVAGTFRKSGCPCVDAHEIESCEACDFFMLVKQEEGANFEL